MRKCHIDHKLNFYGECVPHPISGEQNTTDCEDDLYDALVAMDTLCNSHLKFDIDFVDSTFFESFDQLKAKVLMDELERIRARMRKLEELANLKRGE